MANKHYPQQFKADAVALYRTRPGATIALIADDLGRGWAASGVRAGGTEAFGCLVAVLCPAGDEGRVREDRGAEERIFWSPAA